MELNEASLRDYSGVHSSVVVLGRVVATGDVTIGPYTVLGMPAPGRSFGADAASASTSWTETSALPLVLRHRVCIGPHCALDEGSTIDADTWIGHGVRIGTGTTIGRKCEIYYHAEIYDRVVIGEGCVIGGFVCNDSIIEDSAIVLGDLIHAYKEVSPGTKERAPRVRRHAFIGRGARVIGGIEIGEHSYVAAGSVVTKDVPPGRLFRGCPARDAGVAPNPYTERATLA